MAIPEITKFLLAVVDLYLISKSSYLLNKKQ